MGGGNGIVFVHSAAARATRVVTALTVSCTSESTSPDAPFALVFELVSIASLRAVYCGLRGQRQSTSGFLLRYILRAPSG